MHSEFLLTSPWVLELLYAALFVFCLTSIYYVLAKYGSEELPRKTIDQLFFLIIGVSAVIWILSKI